MTIQPLNGLWRPNVAGPAPVDTQDRELVRQYAGMPGSENAIDVITEQMNVIASFSPATVLKIQGWINEIEDLEETHAGKVADGTAFLGDVEEYEGLRPGFEPTRAELVKKADVLEWDVESLARVRIKTGPAGGQGTATGSLQARIGELKTRVLTALGLQDLDPSYGSFSIERS